MIGNRMSSAVSVSRSFAGVIKMQRISIALIAFSMVSVSACFAEDIADVIAAHNQYLSNLADGEVVSIILHPHGLAWSITFRPNGSVHAQYGATLGDGASQAKGTVDFDALLQAVERLKIDKRQAKFSQVAVCRKGQTTVASFSLRDDTLFRYLIASFENTWMPDLHGLRRFGKLLESHPFYDDDKTRTKSTQESRRED